MFEDLAKGFEDIKKRQKEIVEDLYANNEHLRTMQEEYHKEYTELRLELDEMLNENSFGNDDDSLVRNTIRRGVIDAEFRIIK